MIQPIQSFQTILGADGKPAFVVVPYADFVARFAQSGDLVPDAVVKLTFDDGMSPAKAWRTHLLLTQAEVAANMGVTQSDYALLEASAKLTKTTREQVATALGVSPKQLDF